MRLPSISLSRISTVLSVVAMLVAIPTGIRAQFGPKGVCRALVVGISNYQDDHIPDLHFAHKDAEAFADYLKNRPADRVAPENLHLLTNEQATAGNVNTVRVSFIRDSRPGDKVILYFAGHGDVETLYEDNPGYLLTYDTPADIYSLGSLRLDDVKRTVTALVKREVQVLIITDACHAGKLAGSEVNGTRATTAALGEQFNSEVKVLSCQPDEYSQEGEQWGGGRGVFSWYLIQGLTGMADADNDLQVSLKELQRFLEDRIEPDVAPFRQTPMVVGDRNTDLAIVDEDQLLALKKELYPDQFTDEPAIASRTTSELTAVERDSAWTQLLVRLETAAGQKRWLESDLPPDAEKGSSVRALSNHLAGAHPGHPDVNTWRDRLLAGLQTDAQQAIAAYLRNDQKELLSRWTGQIIDLKKYVTYLKEAAAMLDPGEDLCQRLLAQSYYFEAVLIRLGYDLGGRLNRGPLLEARDLVDSARALEPRAAYIPNEAGLILYRLDSLSSALQLYRTAIARAPTWAMPMNNLAIVWMDLGQTDSAFYWASEALRRDSTAFGSYNVLARIYTARGKGFLAEEALQEAIRQNPGIALPLMNLANYWVAAGKPTLAEPLFQQALANPPKQIINIDIIGNFYLAAGDVDRAGHYFDQTLRMDPNYTPGLLGKSLVLKAQGDLSGASTVYSRALQTAPQDPKILYDLGNALLFNAHSQEAAGILDLALTHAKNQEEQSQIQGALGLAYLNQGQLELARHALRAAIDHAPPPFRKYAWYNLACTEARSGHPEDALTALTEALKAGFPNSASIRQDPDLATIRDLPQFGSILQSFEQH